MLKGDVSFSDLLYISKELRIILDPKVDKIYAGDIFVAIDIMDSLNRQISATLTNVTKQELSDFLQVWIPFNLTKFSICIHIIMIIIIIIVGMYKLIL